MQDEMISLPIRAAPYEHQRRAAAFALDRLADGGGAALLMEMGTGKTLTSIGVVGRLRMTGTGPVAERPGDYWLWTDMYSERETALSNKMKKGLVLKPGERYRLSWFVKVGLEPRQIGGGAAVSINLSGADGKWKKSWIVPGRLAYHSGNVDWIHQTTEFDVPKDAPADVRCSVMPFVRYCVGEAWFDGLLLVNSH